MKLYELETGAIEKELANTANDIEKDNMPKPGLNPSGKNPNPEQQSRNDFQELTNDPEIPTDNIPGEADDLSLPPKNIDPAMVALVQDKPYVTNYNHKDSSPLRPFNILQQDLSKLHELRTMVRNKISEITLSDKIGTWDNPDITFFRDLINFIEDLIDIKKKKPDNSGPENVPKPSKQKKSS